MMTIKTPFLALFAAAVLTAGMSLMTGEKHAHAHGSDHVEKHGHGAKHGGQFVEVEGHHGIEMVSDETSVGFFLTEDGKPMDIEGGSFKAIVQTDAGTKIVPLTVEDGKLAGKLEGALPKGAKVAFSGKDAHGHAIQGRFVKE